MCQGPNYYNMNRLWNRDTIHGVAGQITHWLWQEVIADADLTVDAHSLQAEKPLHVTRPTVSVIARRSCSAHVEGEQPRLLQIEADLESTSRLRHHLLFQSLAGFFTILRSALPLQKVIGTVT